MPRVLALAGRRTDAVGAQVRRFPIENLALVRNRLDALMAAQKPEALVCSAAAGADLLALDVACERGLQLRVVLPFQREPFREKCVMDGGGDFGGLFDRILDVVERRGELVCLEAAATPDESYLAANEAILSQAARLARPDPPIAVIVWEGRSRGPDDYTQAFGNAARERGLTVLEVLTL